jgi:hypothetical protein
VNTPKQRRAAEEASMRALSEQMQRMLSEMEREAPLNPSTPADPPATESEPS